MDSYALPESEVERLCIALEAAYSFPFIPDVEGYVWESILAFVKDIPYEDPLVTGRTKALFDVRDHRKAVGWSAKALQRDRPARPGEDFEVVIQRADIIKKRVDLGFPALSLDSEPNELGSALLEHWKRKIDGDAKSQRVHERRVAILLKAPDRKQFALVDELLPTYDAEELTWRWANDRRTGLHGSRNSDGQRVYRWYPNQKQFFERIVVPESALFVEITLTRLQRAEAVALLRHALLSSA